MLVPMVTCVVHVQPPILPIISLIEDFCSGGGGGGVNTDLPSESKQGRTLDIDRKSKSVGGGEYNPTPCLNGHSPS